MSTRQLPTIEYLRQCFRYENGKLFWLPRPRSHFTSDRSHAAWNAKLANKEAGTDSNKSKRWKVCINGVVYLRSRVVWAYHFGSPPAMVDHRNRNKLDDNIDNLRPTTHSLNAANTTLHIDNQSGVKGVSWNKRLRKWLSCIKVNGVNFHLGYHANIDSAKEAYASAAKLHFGEHHHT